MNPANPPANFMGAPELLHVATALAALNAPEVAFRLENLEIDDLQRRLAHCPTGPMRIVDVV